VNELTEYYAALFREIQDAVLEELPWYCKKPKGLREDKIRAVAARFAEAHLIAPWLLAREKSA
jgi:hypothetical protein